MDWIQPQCVQIFNSTPKEYLKKYSAESLAAGISCSVAEKINFPLSPELFQGKYDLKLPEITEVITQILLNPKYEPQSKKNTTKSDISYPILTFFCRFLNKDVNLRCQINPDIEDNWIDKNIREKYDQNSEDSCNILINIGSTQYMDLTAQICDFETNNYDLIIGRNTIFNYRAEIRENELILHNFLDIITIE
jgi:hypothetical protein